MRLPRLILLAAGCLSGALSASAEKVQFNRDIRPIFSDTCYACHGPDENKIKGGLRLDSLEAARKGGKSGDPAIIPGAPEKSAVMNRLPTDDPDEHTPPAESHKVLTNDQIAPADRPPTARAAHHGPRPPPTPPHPALPPIPPHPTPPSHPPPPPHPPSLPHTLTLSPHPTPHALTPIPKP